jgi:hypothetical protein
MFRLSCHGRTGDANGHAKIRVTKTGALSGGNPR